MSLPNKPQLFILALCRLSEPLSNTCLLPYLYYLIRSLQTGDTTSQASISRQAGLPVSLFALSQFATSVPWASFANHYGRKRTIIIGLVLSIASNIGFGFSTTIPAVMCWRVLAGIGNGNIGVMRTWPTISNDRTLPLRIWYLRYSDSAMHLPVSSRLARNAPQLSCCFGHVSIRLPARPLLVP